MAIKRIIGKGYTKYKTCLNCDRPIEQPLKDDKVYICPKCGQEHFVDVYEKSVVLTRKEYPHLRRRHSGNETELQQRRNLEALIRKIEEERRAEQQHIENEE